MIAIDLANFGTKINKGVCRKPYNVYCIKMRVHTASETSGKSNVRKDDR